jgi:hypothetical protein
MKRFATITLWVLLIFIVIVFYFLLSMLARYWFVNPIYVPPDISLKQQLEKEGVVRIPNLLSAVDIEMLTRYGKENKILDAKRHILQSPKIRRMVVDILGEDYAFQDYIFFIKKSQFHTCHRDYNGDLYNADQHFPSYTILFYLNDMGNCLDVLPASHLSMKDNYNWTDKTQTVQCSRGDAILFNANMVHNGSLNENNADKNMRIQMKLSHVEDRKTLDFYNNYNKVLDQNDKSPMIVKQLQKHVTCQFPVLGGYIKQYDTNVDKDTNKSATNNSISSVFAHLFPVLLTISE